MGFVHGLGFQRAHTSTVNNRVPPSVNARRKSSLHRTASGFHFSDPARSTKFNFDTIIVSDYRRKSARQDYEMRECEEAQRLESLLPRTSASRCSTRIWNTE